MRFSAAPPPEPDIRVQLAGGRRAIAGVGGERQHLQLFNPANSGVLLRVSGVWARRILAGELRFMTNAAAIGAASVDVDFLDSRQAGSPLGEVRFLSQVGLVAGTLFAEFDVPADISEFITLRMVLDEGAGVVMHSNADDVDMLASYFWSEEPR